MSAGTVGIHLPNIRPCPATPEGAAIAALDDLLARFAPLAVEPEPVRTVRGTALALAEFWLIRLPEGPAKTKALDALDEAAGHAVEAAAGCRS